MPRGAAEFNVGIQASVPEIARGAAEYTQRMGFSPRPDSFNNVVVDLPQAQGIARDYLAAPDFDPAALPHYKAMREEIGHQYDFMTRPVTKGGLGLVHTVTAGDPYSSAREMMTDVANGRIKSLSTRSTGSHPFFTDDENDMFRAVHDVFGHAGSGRNFGPSGEEAAFRSHYGMFSPMARQAMAVGTRGQNSTNNFGGQAPGTFVKGKTILLPATSRFLPTPAQLELPKRLTAQSSIGLPANVGQQLIATVEHARSFGTPGNPHPKATWLLGG
jgi:hypothetical protein